MKILVLWHTGTRNRSTFRMLLSTSAVEKRATAMLGEEQWISVNIHAKDIETVRQRAIDALAMGYLNMGLLDGAKWPEPRITTPGPGSASCDLMIDLGEVVMS